MARPISIRAALPGIARFARHFAPYLREHRLLITGAMAALLGQALLQLVEPWPLKFIIDRIVGAENGRFRSPYLASLDANTLLALLAIALVLIIALRSVFTYYATVGFALIGNRVLTQLRNAVFRHIQTLPLAFHDRARGGDLVVRVIGDIGMVKEVAVTAVLPMLGNLAILLGMFAVMFWLHWQLALIALATTPLLWLTTLKQSRQIQLVARRNRSREGEMAATASESMGAIKTVQALSMGGQFADSFSSASNKSLKEGVKGKRLAAGLERSVDILIAIATALVLWYGAHQVLRGALTPGDLLVFVFYLQRAFRPLRDFAKYTARLAKASAAGERVLDLMEQEPGIQDRDNAIAAPRFRGDIEFANLSFGYEQGSPVLQDINLQISAGTRLAIVGPSGSGKSTLTGLLLRLYEPQQGFVAIDGQDIRTYTQASLRSRISIVLQDGLLFATSVRENITGGMPGGSHAAVEAAARLANAHEFIARLPAGYDSVIGERGLTLSNGQRQRISIARAAIRQAPLLILDEPTTGLDPANEQAVSAALQRLAQGCTTVLITHREDMAAQADRVVYLRQGRIVAQGTHEELLAKHRDYAQLFGQAQHSQNDHSQDDQPQDDQPQDDQPEGGAHALAR
jgi:ATP-binding cassette subfamily B protein